jgi:hypothetical protein
MTVHPGEQKDYVPADERDWLEKQAMSRGMGDEYKKLFSAGT